MKIEIHRQMKAFQILANGLAKPEPKLEPNRAITRLTGTNLVNRAPHFLSIYLLHHATSTLDDRIRFYLCKQVVLNILNLGLLCAVSLLRFLLPEGRRQMLQRGKGDQYLPLAALGRDALLRFRRRSLASLWSLLLEARPGARCRRPSPP